MKMLQKIALIAMCAVVAGGAQARDTILAHSIKDALTAANTVEKFDPAIGLYFGNQTTPGVLKRMREVTANKKTNAFNKSDEEACRWAFLSAVLSLQGAARAAGGNAVINIKSNYKKQETVSDTDYICGAGAFIGGVTLKGTIAVVGK